MVKFNETEYPLTIHLNGYLVFSFTREDAALIRKYRAGHLIENLAEFSFIKLEFGTEAIQDLLDAMRELELKRNPAVNPL